MSPSTRTARSSKSTDSSGPAETAVTDVIASNAKYVAKAPGTVFAEFVAYAVNESEGTYKTKAENDAFVLGVRLGGLQASFQKARKDGKIPNTETLSEYAIRTSGVSVPASGPARTALLAGIGTISRYRKIRNAIDAAKAPKVENAK